MEHRAVIRFFTLKGLKAKPIQAELESGDGTDACKLSMLKKWRSRFLQGSTTLFDNLRSGRPRTQDLAEAVRSMLNEKPFTSCTVLCRHFRIVKTTCLWILHDELQWQKFHLRWVPHALSSNQKSERVTYSSLLLEVLEEAQRTGVERVITGDESWFFLS
jgi:histone-lysine N-methyltransferase SETMAR